MVLAGGVTRTAAPCLCPRSAPGLPLAGAMSCVCVAGGWALFFWYFMAITLPNQSLLLVCVWWSLVLL